MDTIWQDLRYGFRGLRNQPAFTTLAALALALGIGATTAIFSVIYNVLLDPFPYKEARRVVALQIRNAERANQGGRNYFETAEFLDYVAQATVFEDVIANGYEEILHTTREGTEFFDGGLMSPNTFGFLGVPALVGRTLTPDDAKPGAPPVFVMAYKMWAKHFNFDPAVVGRTFTFNGIPVTCVGVMPKRFTKLNADLYKPVVLDRADAKLAETYFMFQAKLKPGVTVQQAEAELTLIAKRLAGVYPRNYPANKAFVVRIVSWVDNVVGPFRQTLNMLAGAGLLMRSFIKLQSVDLGYDSEQVLFVRVPLPRGQYETADAKQRFLSQLLTRVKALPGVTAATTSTSLPPYGGIGSEIEIPGKTFTETQNAILQLVSEDYFKTLGMRLLRGRLLDQFEISDARRVIVVNQAMVNKHFAGEDPIGRRIQFKRLATLPNAKPEDAVFEIIGVVSDVMNSGVRDPVRPEAFMPYSVTGAFERVIMVRTAGDPLALVNTVRSEIWAQDRGVAVTMTDSLENFLKNYTYSQPRFVLTVLAVFAAVGLTLVTLGVYSVLAYTVSRQTHEFGIRMALGATRADVLRLVLRNGLLLVVGGIVIGGLASLGLTQVLKTQDHLWNVSPRDPMTFVLVIAVVLIVGLAACLFPARRATRVDPMIALRHE